MVRYAFPVPPLAAGSNQLEHLPTVMPAAVIPGAGWANGGSLFM
jgi:hypothetical protein